jgi:hypothetical protein
MEEWPRWSLIRLMLQVDLIGPVWHSPLKAPRDDNGILCP